MSGIAQALTRVATLGGTHIWEGANHRVPVGLALAVLCALVGYGAMRPISNSDFGWHAAMGRYIVEQRAIPRTEPFTHTARGAPMVAHQWLSQVIYHGAIDSVGILGLRVAHAALAALLPALFFGLLRREGVERALALAAACLFLVLVQGRFQVRPHMINMSFLLLMYGYLFVLRPQLELRQLLGVFAATLLWVNLHSGALLFSAFVVLYVVVEALQQWVGWRTPLSDDLGGGDRRRLAALALLASAPLLLTPNHLRLIPYYLETARINQELSLEWVSILRHWGQGTFVLEAVALIAVVAPATAFYTVRRQSLSELALVLTATALPFKSQRFLWLYFIPLLFLVRELSRWARLAAEGAPGERRRLAASLLVVALGLLAAAPVLLSTVDLRHPLRRFEAEWNVASRRFPTAALSFLDEVNLRGRLFNPNRWGGYILLRTYDKYPTFVDGRWVTIGEQVVRDSKRIALRRDGTFQKLDEYGVDILLVERGWMRPESEPGWIPLFENFNSGVYLRDSPGNVANLRRAAAYYRARGIPFDPERGFEERAALGANPEWARRFRVQRRHLDRFHEPGVRRHHLEERWVEGW
jgi:hypothetical protein